MNEINQERIVVKGKMIRTDNQSIEEIIQLWSDISKMGISGEIFAVYSNYESDHNGKYDLLIGNNNLELDNKITIEAGNYLVIDVENSSPEMIGEAWYKIWNNQTIYDKRLFTTDFERYFTDGSAKIYLAVS